MKELFPRTGAGRANVSLSNQPDDEHLRERARVLLETGALPRRRPDRVWGGRGGGGECPVCGDKVTADEVEMELEYAGEGGSLPDFVHMHVGCFAALERAARHSPATAHPPEPKGKIGTMAAGGTCRAQRPRERQRRSGR